MIDSLFEKELAGRGVFKDLNVLGPHYIPDQLPHRSVEARAITRIIAPILRNERPNNIFIYGKTGTGKTSVVKYVMRKLEEIIADSARNKNNVCVKVVYMNCRLGYNSKYQVLLRILEDDSLRDERLQNRPLDDRADGKLTGFSPTELYERLRSVVEGNVSAGVKGFSGGNNLNLVVVLDEVDMIKDIGDLMYVLTRVNDEIKSGYVSLVGISNSYSFKENLDPRSKSTLCEEELVFKPYNARQLKSILAQRVKLGFWGGAIADSHVDLIAGIAAQTNGDARYALKLLRKAGEVAQNDGRVRIKVEDVRAARIKVEEDIVGELITSLPEHQQIVLYSIAEAALRGSHYKRFSDMPEGVLFSGEIYESYEHVCRSLQRSPRTMRWFREYLNDLEMLGLITLSISGKGVRGNTSLIRLGNPPEEVKNIVSTSLGLK